MAKRYNSDRVTEIAETAYSTLQDPGEGVVGTADIGELVEDAAGEEARYRVDRYLAQRYGDGEDPSEVGNEEYLQALRDTAGKLRSGISYIRDDSGSERDAIDIIEDNWDRDMEREAKAAIAGRALSYFTGPTGYVVGEAVFTELLPRVQEWEEDNDLDLSDYRPRNVVNEKAKELYRDG